MRDEVIIAALLLAAYWILTDESGGSPISEFTLVGVDVTAGDEQSNFLSDAVDDMTSIFTGWPPGSGPYQQLIASSASANGMPAEILAWQLWKESRYNPAIINGTIKSRVGAMGIGQFMPATAREELGSEAAALDPQRAIPGVAAYMAKLYRKTGSWKLALAAYNWGIGNVQRQGIDAAPAETVDYYSTILKKAGGNYA